MEKENTKTVAAARIAAGANSENVLRIVFINVVKSGLSRHANSRLYS